MKLSAKELRERLAIARNRARSGAFYKHRKSGGIYRVTGHSIREEDGVALVRYRPIEGPLATSTLVTDDIIEFVRPCSEFIEAVEFEEDGARKIGSRFVRVVYEEGYKEAVR